MYKSFNYLKASLAIVILSTLSDFAWAQKLPSEQKESVYAPANVKIDGNPAEWIGKFQAQNNPTLLTYVMANDEENLYLTIQTGEKLAIGKIYYGGISLEIKSKADKKATPLKITYPLVTNMQRSEIVKPLRDKTNNADSAATVVNLALGKYAKTIAVAGFTDITDPDISVYNDLGINAMVRVDNTRTMTFEYRLPLKYIKHLLDNNAEFDYRIIVNGDKLDAGTVVVAGGRPGSTPAPVNYDVFTPTDLKASYKLAKK